MLQSSPHSPGTTPIRQRPSLSSATLPNSPLTETPSQGDSDETLMAAYVAGDEAAYRILFDRYAPLLYRIVRRRVASDDEAHDVVQQAFLNMHRFREDFRTDARLRPWLTTIAMNLVREHHRRLGRRRERSLDATEGRVQPVDPKTPVEDLQHVDSVRKAMRSLLDNQREVIELRWFEDKSYDEISEIVGASVAAVRVRAHRGYERLRGALLAEAC